MKMANYKVIFSVIFCLLTLFFQVSFSSLAKAQYVHTVCIDPGHGGDDIGAPGWDGDGEPNEEDITLQICHNHLEYWINEIVLTGWDKLYVTRIEDVNVSLQKRVKIAKGEEYDAYGNKPNKAVDLFVSVHCNSSADASKKGTSIMIWDKNATADDWVNNPPTDTKRFKLAKYIIEDYIYHTSSIWPGACIWEEGGDGIWGRGTDVYVLWKTPMPANVVETEFISNYDGWYYLQNEFYQDAAGQGIAQGIGDYYDGVDEQSWGGLLPTQNSLSQNFPNPFNPKTKIGYAISKRERVKIIVFNLVGQKVRTLVDEEKLPGYHVIWWNSKDDNDQPVASGVYFCKMEASSFSEAKKMLLIR